MGPPARVRLMKPTAIILGVGISGFATACCGVGSGGAEVHFTGQQNIVIWDAKNGVEHFVRNAQFETKGKDLGFLAPTPSKPTLSDSDKAAFSTLGGLQPIGFSIGCAKGDDEAGGVQVVGEQDVAGYHATILKSADAGALRKWLASNGYPAPKFLDFWLKKYTDRGWFLTAFKVRTDETTETGPVRMTFKTNRPFNPYSVPAENGGGGADLRLYFVSAGNEVPKIGGTGAWREASWTADIPESSAKRLAAQLKLPAAAIPGFASVSLYKDHDFGAPGFDDLYFVPDPHSPWPALLTASCALLLGRAILYRRMSRRRSAPTD